MNNTNRLLANISIDSEFKKTLVKIFININDLIMLSETGETQSQKIAYLDLADFLIRLFQENYLDNTDYQQLIKTYKDEIASNRELYEKAFICENFVNKPTLLQ